MKNKLISIIQIIVFFILPIILLISEVIPIKYRFTLLGIVVTISILIVIIEKWSLKKLGIRLDNFKKSFLIYTLFTIFSVLAIFILANILGNKTQNIFGNSHFRYGFILLSILQEFLFHSFLIPKLKIIFSSPVFAILSNAILFGFLHLIFQNPLTTFTLATILGIGFAWIYYYKPNIILSSISHSIINFIAVFYCFASLSGC